MSDQEESQPRPPLLNRSNINSVNRSDSCISRPHPPSRPQLLNNVINRFSISSMNQGVQRITRPHPPSRPIGSFGVTNGSNSVNQGVPRITRPHPPSRPQLLNNVINRFSISSVNQGVSRIARPPSSTSTNRQPSFNNANQDPSSSQSQQSRYPRPYSSKFNNIDFDLLIEIVRTKENLYVKGFDHGYAKNLKSWIEVALYVGNDVTPGI